MIWEYKSVILNEMTTSETDALFNELGREGWELVAISDEVAYFKRRKAGIVRA